MIDSLHLIQVPTLLINGKFDEAQNVSMQPFFDEINRVKWVTLENSSHFGHVEESERFVEVVGEFLI